MRYLRTLKADTWLPFFMPCVWRWLLGIALVGGIAIGVWIWLYTLQIRGL
jgi:hypothetical protein